MRDKNAGPENTGPILLHDKIYCMNCMKINAQNVLCIVVLNLYSFLLQCIDYFLTAVVISAFNWCNIN